MAFDPIRHNAASQPLILAHLLDGLERLSERTRRLEDRAAVLAYAATVRERMAVLQDSGQ
jgi:hypothetical protein